MRKEKTVKSRGNFVCSTNLLEIINLANSIGMENIWEVEETLQSERKKIINALDELMDIIEHPKSEEDDDLYDLRVEQYKQMEEQFALSFTDITSKVVKESAIFKFITEQREDNSETRIWDYVLMRFHDLISIRDILYNVASSRQDITFPFSKLDSFYFFGEFQLQGRIHITNEGFIKPGLSEIFAIFQDENIYFNNIRICEICKKLFWAKRQKSVTCSHTCSNILANRNFRREKRKEINEKRRKNYACKQKKLKEKKNGTLQTWQNLVDELQF